MSKRRGNGEGTIVQRADGRWMASYTYQDTLGNSKRKTLYAKTQKECRTRLTAALRAVDQGELPNTGQWTVERFLNHLRGMSNAEALHTAGVLSERFWLRGALSNLVCGPA